SPNPASRSAGKLPLSRLRSFGFVECHIGRPPSCRVLLTVPRGESHEGPSSANDCLPQFGAFDFVFLFALQSQSQVPDSQQVPPGPGSVKVVPDLTPQNHEQVAAYWTSETGWNTELQLRNNLLDQDLIVTPVVRRSDGAETDLAAITIKPQEVKGIDLDASISAANAPQLVGTYGSIVLRYSSTSRGNLYATTMIRRTGHSIAFHIDAMSGSQDFQAGSREGVWWLPNDTTTDYLILTNQDKNTIPLVLSLFDANGK